MKVSKIMTDRVITAAPDDGIRATFFKMRQHRVRHMPVVDEDGRLVGIISDRDLRRPDWVDEAIDIAHVYRLDDNLSVGDIMTTRVQTVHTYDSVRKATDFFVEHRYGALPVINKEGALVGILSPIDILRTMQSIMHDNNLRSGAPATKGQEVHGL